MTIYQYELTINGVLMKRRHGGTKEVIMKVIREDSKLLNPKLTEFNINVYKRKNWKECEPDV